MGDQRADVIGWFVPGAAEPEHDPGMQAPCVVCGVRLKRPVVTVSLVAEHGDRSLFFRAHRDCWRSLDEAEQNAIESSVIDRDAEADG